VLFRGCLGVTEYYAGVTLNYSGQSEGKMNTKSSKKAKQMPVSNEDEDDVWTYEIEQLFGKNRKLQPSERNLISLFYNNMKSKLQSPPEGSRWVMLMAVDLSTYTVIEQAAVSTDWADERWRHFFQWMYVDSFVTSPKDVAKAAFNDYKNGQRSINILCQRYDNLYTHLDEEGRKETRSTVRKMLNKMLHAEPQNTPNKSSPKKSSKPYSKKKPS
jgi:hypothetical protein